MNELTDYNPEYLPRGPLFYYPKLMQKIINALALTSFAVSGVAVAGGAYVYVNKDAILADIQSQVMEQVTGGLAGGLTGGLPDVGSALPIAGGVPTLGDGLPVMGSVNNSSEEDEATPAIPPVLPPIGSSPFNKISETSQETTEERQARREAVGLGSNVTISTVDGNRHLR